MDSKSTPKPLSIPKEKKRTGGIFSVIVALASLLLSGFLYLAAHGKSTVTVNGKVVDSEAAKLGGDLVLGWLSMPLIIVVMVAASIAVLIAFIRLFKNTTVGRVICVIAIALGIWAINIAVGLFNHYGNL